MEEKDSTIIASRVEIKATVAVGQYQNIQPSIEFSGNIPMKQAMETGLDYIKDIFRKYSEKGAIRENEVPKAVAVIKSFNEGVEVNFEPLAHVYTHNGNMLTSATTYIKRFYKEFNKSAIAGASAKAWGVDEAHLGNLWESNGVLTSAMGKVIHSALEHYDKFKELGDTVKAKKELEENYAMPKHPLLRNIIKGFIEIDKVEGQVFSEVLVTDIENGVCGTADRIKVVGDIKDKTCWIEDYKINIESEKIDKSMKCLEPWADLPSNKLSKYNLQMGIYANMLQKSGWKVLGLRVFVFEETWKSFELPVLQVLPKKEVTSKPDEGKTA